MKSPSQTANISHLFLFQTTAGFELYLVFEPLISKPSATNAVNKLLRWIKKEEDKIFMLNNYTL